jgi:hypothetical protein
MEQKACTDMGFIWHGTAFNNPETTDKFQAPVFIF